eukprot:CAMPEP_0175062054 /NCGR_PEP_ID=MMETSP0052_2-20121109/13939_1 /TAXON_ID=51329 ORGANISM="Polytomella parva, Strain SAG 63-3" /NCGR_SAMPLE_ID=MMETSP0052_2 /ASSEMBLY_ACC=CAM_ASM_000194 /LENGTH=75 /DNA_ID=CAMNT_0016328001 /DNA_START=1 /DNA_END=225 /DNA_ORIENTATION=-
MEERTRGGDGGEMENHRQAGSLPSNGHSNHNHNHNHTTTNHTTTNHDYATTAPSSPGAAMEGLDPSAAAAAAAAA